MRHLLRAPACALIGLFLAIASFAQTPAPVAPPQTQPQTQRERKPQPRPFGTRIVVDASKLVVDDGDTAEITWTVSDSERVRILGIDTPETRHPSVDLPFAQSFGEEARAFAKGAFATATKIELLRSSTLDPYGRTLGYFFLNDKNYSVLVVNARLAEETVTQYGDNGLPNEAAAVSAAAKATGPVPFESPGNYRKRMRDFSRGMQSRGMRPEQ